MFEADYFWIIMTVFVVAAIIVQVILDRRKTGHRKKQAPEAYGTVGASFCGNSYPRSGLGGMSVVRPFKCPHASTWKNRPRNRASFRQCGTFCRTNLFDFSEKSNKFSR